MALSGIQIYKLLPQTNCKECGFPTCLAFAMKLAAKQVELVRLPVCQRSIQSAAGRIGRAADPPGHRSNRTGTKSRPAMKWCCSATKRPSTTSPVCSSACAMIDAGGCRSRPSWPQADAYAVNYVGMDLTHGWLCRRSRHLAMPASLPPRSRPCAQPAKRPLILISQRPGRARGRAESARRRDAADLRRRRRQLGSDGRPGQDSTRLPWRSAARSLDELADLTEKIKAKGVEDLVLDPAAGKPGRIPGAKHPDPPAGAQEELPRPGLPDHRSSRDNARSGSPGDRQVCGFHRA